MRIWKINTFRVKETIKLDLKFFLQANVAAAKLISVATIAWQRTHSAPFQAINSSVEVWQSKVGRPGRHQLEGAHIKFLSQNTTSGLSHICFDRRGGTETCSYQRWKLEPSHASLELRNLAMKFWKYSNQKCRPLYKDHLYKGIIQLSTELVNSRGGPRGTWGRRAGGRSTRYTPRPNWWWQVLPFIMWKVCKIQIYACWQIVQLNISKWQNWNTDAPQICCSVLSTFKYPV